MNAPYGFRLVGALYGRRRLVDWRSAFAAYCDADARAALDQPGYLSAYSYPAEYRDHAERCGTPKGYAGPAAAPFVWWDIDRAGDLAAALADACRLACALLERYRGCDDDGLLLFFSGAKGFHVGLPLGDLAGVGVGVPLAVRHFAEAAAARAGVAVDVGVYDRVRPFRAPNSRHAATGLHKRRLTLDELLHLDAERVAVLARDPASFDAPAPVVDAVLAADWRAAAETAGRTTSRRADAGTDRLQRETLDFIRDGADVGSRSQRLFRAAANLAEFGCPSALAGGLLTPAALDSGLSPAETRRQIECGLAHANRPSGGDA